MVLNGIKAVFFDLDNTLIDTSGASKKAMEKVFKLLIDKSHFSEEEAGTICNNFQTKLLHEDFDSSKMTIDDLRVSHFETSMQDIRSGDHRDLAKECYNLWKTIRLQLMTLPESTKNMLRELRKSASLVLLTNGNRQVQREKIEACGVSPYFDAVVVGGEHAEEKPAPSIFLHCCELVQVKPEDCVMVGDNLDTDILGGLNAGLKATIWLNKNPHLNSDPKPAPHYVINCITRLPEVLQNLQ
ncbi:N-acylneuraminate-9-phosphatase isoform X2 [Hyla sarda]|nr:N-acylneuraminate-9-phosphatase isoform X2 [Hyla sarda]XP_056423544.1 N-acylneuraminate-9-phosphatase isoform X2 [Hyla sarda]XP_056423545.1 N-acylneuraminate-9-phosphatase isoform X2 [Hyla sarda]XP_056423546.1 N-acylneuraminate-9-phosphatase isoform X2 [Hyla sarda]